MEFLQHIDRTSHLGWHSQYYYQSGQNLSVGDDFAEAYGALGSLPQLDEIAVTEVLNKYYMLGDRTILCGLKRHPWMSYLSSDATAWLQHPLPQHGYNQEAPQQIADRLFHLLCQEIKSYVGEKTRVGLLLSGGMDSRIVAGCLHFLIDQGKLNLEKVVAYTWGEENSRDVVYSKRIAELFTWEWQRFQVGPQDLWDNFVIAGRRGCEFTGFHLHAIPQIATNLEVEVMLAGSYGDSVGRAEYSGRHVTRLRPIADQLTNPAFLLKSSVFARAEKEYSSDVDSYHQLFPRTVAYAQHELDYQLHYMRRMLNPCMSLIGERIEMHQAFTHPATFGYMWSLKPECRNNLPYKFILDKLGSGLVEIPWARTGLKYLETTGQPDSFTRQHHRYSQFTQSNLIEQIEDRLMSHHSLKDSIVNMHAATKLIRLIRSHSDYNFDYLERLGWLVSFTYFLDMYPVSQQNEQPTFADWFKGNLGLPIQYLTKRAVRKLRNKLQ